MKPFLSRLAPLWKWFIEALFPKKCLICRKEGDYLCTKHKTFQPAPPNQVRFHYLDKCTAGTKYFSSPSDKMVDFFKFKGFKDLSEIMAKEMIKELSPQLLKEAVFLPIPLHWTRFLWRGFNQSKVLLLAIKKQHPTLQICYDLKRVKRTNQQARLSKKHRAKNLKEAFCWKGFDTPPQKIVLVDDVVASGKTLEAAAKTLKQAGAKKVMGIVFARGGKN